MTLFRWLAKARRLRGTPLDLFARLPERRLERRLLAEYEDDVAAVLGRLAPATLDAAVELASLPEAIRGFGHVKAGSIAAAMPRRSRLRELLDLPADDGATG
jgi:indolepyruvate ferredoxin oxidoreductase